MAKSSLPCNVMRLEAPEYGGTVSVNIVPCSINGRKAFILRTDANEEGRGHHPKTILEIAADVRLRDYFHLSDGDICRDRNVRRVILDGRATHRTCHPGGEGL